MARRPLDTRPEPRSLADVRAARRLRRIGLVGIWLVVIAGLGGLLGVKTGTTAAAAEGYRLQVSYPRITRAGLAAPYEVRVIRTGGFGDRPITLAVSRELFALFDFQNFYPSPAGETADARFVYYDSIPRRAGPSPCRSTRGPRPTATVGRCEPRPRSSSTAGNSPGCTSASGSCRREQQGVSRWRSWCAR